MTLDVYLHAFEPPGPPFSYTNEQKLAYPRISTSQVDLKNYPVNHEVMGVYMVLTGKMPEGHTMKFGFKFYNDATGALLYSGSGTIPQPSTEGWEWWNWYSWYAWIGRCAWEISGPMTVRVEVTSSGSPLGTEKKTVYMTVVDTSPPARSTMIFYSIPALANFYLDGAFMGITPQTIEKDALSLHTWKYTLSGYKDLGGNTIWPPSGTATYTGILEPVVMPTTYINFMTNPTGAELYIDGVFKGNTNMVIGAPAGSTHGYTIKKTDYKTVADTITWPATGTLNLTVNLELEEEVGWLAQAKTFILETLPGWFLAIPKLIADVANNIFDIDTLFTVTIPNAIKDAKNYVDGLFENLDKLIPQWIIDAVNDVKDWWRRTTDFVNDAIDDVKGWVSNLVSDLQVLIPQWIIDAANWVRDKASAVWNWIEGAGKDAVNWIVGAGKDIANWVYGVGKDVANFVWGGLTDVYNWITDVALPAVNDFIKYFPKLFNDFYNFLANIVDFVEDAAADLIERSVPTDTEINEKFKENNPLPDVTIGGFE